MNKKKIALIAGILVLLVAAAVIIFFVTKPATTKGSKTVTLKITDYDGNESTVELHTDKEYLLEAMQEVDGLVDGYDSEYGYTITTVNGYFADAEKGIWWTYTCDGEWVMTSANETPIEDGQTYEFTAAKY